DVIEGLRTLRTSLMLMSTAERLRTLAVVSVEPGAGKTFIALNLARETAALEVPVVLVDGDLRRPIVHERLGIQRVPGLADALTGASTIDACGRVIEGWLRVVPAGREVADPAGLFGGRELRSLTEGMAGAELIVFDTPAGGLFADALAIASQCDATLLVIDAQSTRRRPVRHLIENLRQVGAQPIGVVLNRTEPTPRPSYYEGTTTRRTPRDAPATVGGPSATEPDVP
ncbi:MAG TPA: CpsD/CapB family tyrosine-protein kinase, partial [Acidimicrobiales bacterium]|nr:CpsD/CapB family tyrosine-protein kinase [Acidimicrobiales bacterium]